MSIAHPVYVECDKGVVNMMVWKWTVSWITFKGEWRESTRDERDEVVVKLGVIEIFE